MAKPKPYGATFNFLFYTMLFIHVVKAQWVEEKEEGVVDVVMQSHQGLTRRDGCDMSVGQWVYDRTYPLYESNCPYLSSHSNCKKNGRPDLDYEKWRWKPLGCSIPRFNALHFLGKMRRKKIMLVGDSIIRNQWESLVCLIQAVIPQDRKTLSSHGPTTIFHALDYKTSISFSWAPLLVELRDRVLHLDSIEGNAKHWRAVDVLVFGSAHWWTHSGKWRSWDYYMEGKRFFSDLNPMVGYEKGLTTWAKWVDLNLNPRKTQVIFQSVSPRHNRYNGWQCYKQREPVLHLGHTTRNPTQLLVLQQVLKKMRFPVHFQDITHLSALRKDGHPSVYYNKEANISGASASASQASDCSHWCLPGVPDIWNEMLYASIVA